MRAIADAAVSSDEELMRLAASGSAEAIAALYARYAPRVLAVAVQALDRATAEEVVQDVFVSVWKNARAFDPKRGPLRPWLFQIAHHRIANELRRRRRRPHIEDDPEGERLASLPDPAADASRETWEAYRREALGRALEKLPPPQRQALGLAFFSDLSHGEVAGVLGLPLGTVKSRLRSGISQMRARLAPIAAALLVLLLAAGLLLRISGRQAELARDDRALTMLTSSDALAIRLTAAPGQDPATHATYRFRPGSPIAIVTFSKFPAPAPGETDRAWASVGGQWVLLGEAAPDSNGHARFIAEAPALVSAPERLLVAAERGPAGAAPGERTIVSWSADRK